ncbi:hypothetical protein PM082_002333 [Marasmius tenuissimus]|nr:hypothetical protein PM082_002333 [Marasmius tenuissimus]
MPTTLKEWMNEVSNQDCTYHMDREYQAHKRGSGSAQTEKAKKTQVNNHAATTTKTTEVKRETVTTTPHPNAMDIDAMKKKGLCYKCKKQGHRFFKCPEGKGKEKDRFNI